MWFQWHCHHQNLLLLFISRPMAYHLNFPFLFLSSRSGWIVAPSIFIYWMHNFDCLLLEKTSGDNVAATLYISLGIAPRRTHNFDDFYSNLLWAVIRSDCRTSITNKRIYKRRQTVTCDGEQRSLVEYILCTIYIANKPHTFADHRWTYAISKSRQLHAVWIEALNPQSPTVISIASVFPLQSAGRLILLYARQSTHKAIPQSRIHSASHTQYAIRIELQAKRCHSRLPFVSCAHNAHTSHRRMICGRKNRPRAFSNQFCADPCDE